MDVETLRTLLAIVLALGALRLLLDLLNPPDCPHRAIANCGPCATQRAKEADESAERMHAYWHNGYRRDNCPICRKDKP